MKLTETRVNKILSTYVKSGELDAKVKSKMLKDFKAVFSKRISVRSAKNKGAKFQNEIANAFADATGLVYGKDEDIQGREMGQSGTDLRLSRQAREIIPFDVECKKVEQWSVHTWWEQCKNNTAENRIPLLFVTKSNFDKLAILDIKDFFKLWKNGKV